MIFEILFLYKLLSPVNSVELIHHWPLNSHLNDIVGGAHAFNGTNYEFTSDRFDNSKSALRLNNGFLKLPNKTYLNGDFTITAWVKLVSTKNLYNTIINLNTCDHVCQPIIFGFYGERFMLSHFKKNYIERFNVYTKSGEWTHYVWTHQNQTSSIYRETYLLKSLETGKPNEKIKNFNFIGRYANLSHNSIADYNDIKIYNGTLTKKQIENEYYWTGPLKSIKLIKIF